MTDSQTAHYHWMFAQIYGDGPWTCHFCQLPIEYVGRAGRSLIRHHIDGNRDNNSDENLVPAHRSCHNREHAQPNSKITDAGRARISAARREYMDEHYDEVISALHDLSPEAKKRVSEAVSMNNRQRSGPNWLGNQYRN